MRVRQLLLLCAIGALMCPSITLASNRVSEHVESVDEDAEAEQLMEEIPSEDMFATELTPAQMAEKYDDVSDEEALMAQRVEPNEEAQEHQKEIEQLKTNLRRAPKKSGEEEQSPLQALKDQVDDHAKEAVDQFVAEASQEQVPSQSHDAQQLPNNQPERTFPKGSVLYVQEQLFNKLSVPTNRLAEERLALVKINHPFGSLPDAVMAKRFVTLPLKARPFFIKHAFESEGKQWFVEVPDADATEELQSFAGMVQHAEIPEPISIDDITRGAKLKAGKPGKHK